MHRERDVPGPAVLDARAHLAARVVDRVVDQAQELARAARIGGGKRRLDRQELQGTVLGDALGWMLRERLGVVELVLQLRELVVRGIRRRIVIELDQQWVRGLPRAIDPIVERLPGCLEIRELGEQEPVIPRVATQDAIVGGELRHQLGIELRELRGEHGRGLLSQRHTRGRRRDLERHLDRAERPRALADGDQIADRPLGLRQEVRQVRLDRHPAGEVAAEHRDQHREHEDAGPVPIDPRREALGDRTWHDARIYRSVQVSATVA